MVAEKELCLFSSSNFFAEPFYLIVSRNRAFNSSAMSFSAHKFAGAPRL